MDMANNIWSWADSELEYKPNPNPFFSLSKSYFVVGLRPRVSDKDRKIIEQVTKWLKDGLAAGVGSQVNTGYGVVGMSSQTPEPFLKVPFTLEGQLIHGHQLVKWQNDKERFNNTAQEEVRPAAIKSMLRYWFRALALGILPPGTPQDVVNYQKRIEKGEASNPPATVKALEALLFGSITPQCWGWITVRVVGKTAQKAARLSRNGKDDPCGEQVGNLALLFAPDLPNEHVAAVQSIFKSLVWLMFHLGGIGQGARRPCYSRNRAPWYRGSTLIPNVDPEFEENYGSSTFSDEDKDFFDLPDTVQSFRSIFQKHLKSFHSAIGKLTGNSISYADLSPAKSIRHPHEWVEAIDSLCSILVIKELDNETKPTALSILHEQFHKLENRGDRYHAKNLCGHTEKDQIPPLDQRPSNRPVTKRDKAQQKERGAIPSPIWVSDLNGLYQIVTIFGCSQDPRKQFLKTLKEELPNRCWAEIWPLT